MTEIHITEDDLTLTTSSTPFERKVQNLDSLSRHVRREDTRPTIIEHETLTSVTFGVPAILSDTGAPIGIDVPNSPFVFLVNELYARDPLHPDSVRLENVPVIMAHGYRDDKDVWRFADDQNVAMTVMAYNRYALSNGLPPLEFVISCNQENVSNPEKIKIKDLDPTILAVQAVGEVMSFGLGAGPTNSVDGHVVARMSTRGEFFGLDQLEIHKKLLKQIKVQ